MYRVIVVGLMVVDNIQWMSFGSVVSQGLCWWMRKGCCAWVLHCMRVSGLKLSWYRTKVQPAKRTEPTGNAGYEMVIHKLEVLDCELLRRCSILRSL